LRFLRHIERARVLCVLVDLAPLDVPPPAEQERILLAELARYRPELLERPRLTVGTKADVATEAWTGRRMSAVTGAGVGAVVGELARLVHEARQEEPEREGYVVLRPAAEGVRVVREPDGSFRVVGRDAERAVALSDLTDDQALAYADNRLKRLGVDKALARAGAQAGDVVHVAGFSFEYDPDG
jgi:GTP-binding protein